jgi:hypothetical protein
VRTDELERLHCDKDTSSVEDGGTCSYSVNGLTKRAGKIDLVTELDNPAEALFIKQEVERWLKIDHGSVGREARS